MLGLLEYANGNKGVALTELKAAHSLGDSNFRRQLRGAAQRSAFKGILDDQPFLKDLFGEPAGR